jgi:hypothetical protein
MSQRLLEVMQRFRLDAQRASEHEVRRATVAAAASHT